MVYKNPLLKIPVFVYGGLRTGEMNHKKYLSKKTNKTEFARIRGLHMITNGDEPLVIRKPKGIIYGEIHYLNESEYIETLEKIDILQGYYEKRPYLSRFERRQRVAQIADGSLIECWVYMWNPTGECFPPVPGGDWLGEGETEFAMLKQRQNAFS